jgi:hypothetical protein
MFSLFFFRLSNPSANIKLPFFLVQRYSSAPSLVLFLVAVIALSGLVRVLSNLFLQLSSRRFAIETSSMCFASVSSHDYHLVSSVDPRVLTHDIRLLGHQFISFFTTPLFLFVTSLINSLIILLGLFVFDPKPALLLVLIAILIYSVAVSLTRSTSRRDSKVMTSSLHSIEEILSRFTSSLRDIYVYRLTPVLSQQFISNQAKFTSLVSRRNFFNTLPRSVAEPALLISLLAMMLIIYKNPDPSLDFANARIIMLATLAIGLQRVFPYVQQSFNSFGELASHRYIVSSIANLLCFDPKVQSLVSVSKATLYPLSLRLSLLNFNVDCIRSQYRIEASPLRHLKPKI